MSSSVSKAEKSYIQAGLSSNPPLRADGRGLYDFRAIALETGVSPLANGSARVNIGRNAHDGGGGTEVLAAAKLEVENVEPDGLDTGKVVCTVSWSVFLKFLFVCRLNDIKTVLLPHIHTFHLRPWMKYNKTCLRLYTKHFRIPHYILPISKFFVERNAGCSILTSSCWQTLEIYTTPCL